MYILKFLILSNEEQYTRIFPFITPNTDNKLLLNTENF